MLGSWSFLGWLVFSWLQNSSRQLRICMSEDALVTYMCTDAPMCAAARIGAEQLTLHITLAAKHRPKEFACNSSDGCAETHILRTPTILSHLRGCPSFTTKGCHALQCIDCALHPESQVRRVYHGGGTNLATTESSSYLWNTFKPFPKTGTQWLD